MKANESNPVIGNYQESLRKYYITWRNNCIHSMHYCLEKGNISLYEEYKRRRDIYQSIIDEHKIKESESY